LVGFSDNGIKKTIGVHPKDPHNLRSIIRILTQNICVHPKNPFNLRARLAVRAGVQSLAFLN